MMQILVLLDMYFDAAVVFVTSPTLLFRLALAILWGDGSVIKLQFLLFLVQKLRLYRVKGVRKA